jgi:hypothetical protein
VNERIKKEGVRDVKQVKVGAGVRSEGKSELKGRQVGHSGLLFLLHADPVLS